MHAYPKQRTLVIGLALVSLLLSTCGPNTPEPTPTLPVELIQTYAVATFSAGLTQTALAKPTDTPTETPQPTNTLRPSATAGAPQAATPTETCYGLLYVKDVTVPDNTSMTVGQSFTKTWQVRNSGTCAWEAGFKFAHVDGDDMSGTTLTLTKTVQAGATTELSIAMTAPDTTGTITGWWQMSDANGSYFGDALSVIINVGSSSGTETPTPTATETPTPTP
jgi:hypothetical protein